MSFEADLEFLQNEFSANDGSFLIQLRCDLHWDKAAFSRLSENMLRYCQAQSKKEEELLLRWAAEGFWNLSSWVREWTSHPDFKRPYPPEYYEEAYLRLEDLAFFYFTGSSPYQSGEGFEPL